MGCEPRAKMAVPGRRYERFRRNTQARLAKASSE
jgi:hypothetical protein